MSTAYVGKIGKEDLKNWDGKTRTFQRRSSTGGYLDLHAFDLYGIDVIQVCGGGDTATEEELNEAMTLAGSNTRSLWLAPVTWTIGANVTVPSNILLVMAPGSVFSVSAGYTLTIYSPDNIIANPRQQIFSGSGTVAFTKAGTVYPNLWEINNTPGTTDMTSAIQTAITSISLSPPGKVVLLPEDYAISSLITIATDGVAVIGQGGAYASWLTCTAAEAGLKIDKGGGAITYNVILENFAIRGEDTATTGLTLTNANECLYRDLTIQECTTQGIYTSGAYCSGQFQNVKLNGNPTSITITGGAALWFIDCNLYDQTTAVSLSGTTYDIKFINTYFETFDTAFSCVHTAASMIVYGLILDKCYFLTTTGGGSFTARVMKHSTANNDFNGQVYGFVMRDCFISMSAAAYFVEVDWDANTGGGANRFHGSIENCLAQLHTNSTAWFTHDMTSTAVEYINMYLTNLHHTGTQVAYTDATTGVFTMGN